jgi:hypothetical protein
MIDMLLSGVKGASEDALGKIIDKRSSKTRAGRA